MEDPEVAIIPSREADYLFLSRTKQGRLFKKHILNKGDLLHPETGAKIRVDDAFVATMRKNFEDGVCDIVQAPLADAENKHTEAPERNIGEIVDIQEENGKIYAMLDARKPEFADELGKTLLGSSAYISLNYKNDKTNQRVGPTLLHMCVTNRPYVTGLEDYQEIVAATADSVGEAVMFTEAPAVGVVVEIDKPGVESGTGPESQEAATMTTKEELLAALKADHGVDVEAMQTQIAAAKSTADVATELQTALTAKLQETGALKLSASGADSITTEDVVGAVTELAETNVKLTGRIGTLERKNAEAEVDQLVREGRVMPAQREGFVDLKLTNTEMFGKLVPAEPIIKMSAESGITPPEDEKHKTDLDAEIARLTAKDGPAAKYIKSAQ